MRHLLAFSLFVVLVCYASKAGSESVIPYQPETGDKAVTYIHRFKAGDYEKGKDLLEESFGAPLSADGRSRRTFFLENAKENEVMVVSFFHSDNSVEDWFDTPAQKVALEQLDPIHSEPVIMQEYSVGLYHPEGESRP